MSSLCSVCNSYPCPGCTSRYIDDVIRLKAELAAKDREVAILRIDVKEVRARAELEADARWCAALELADWDGGVFHYEGRLYPWPRGFVPDCPATWAAKLRDMARDVESGGLLRSQVVADPSPPLRPREV